MNTPTIELRTQLRDATAPLHKQLNEQPLLAALLGKEQPLADYQQLLGIYYSLYHQLEAAIKAYLRLQPIDFDYQPRYKTPLLLNDLKYWHITPEPLACQIVMPELNSLGALLGLLYVLEGSTLGGQFIAQHLQLTYGYTRSTGSDFYSGYGEQTTTHWQSFITYLNSFSDQPDLAIQAIDTAILSFACFNQALTNTQLSPSPAE
ncbi:MAG: biliverdin-producing heme oxygenase [Methylococcaceae bacterium]